VVYLLLVSINFIEQDWDKNSWILQLQPLLLTINWCKKLYIDELYLVYENYSCMCCFRIAIQDLMILASMCMYLFAK